MNDEQEEIDLAIAISLSEQETANSQSVAFLSNKDLPQESRRENTSKPSTSTTTPFITSASSGISTRNSPTSTTTTASSTNKSNPSTKTFKESSSNGSLSSAMRKQLIKDLSPETCHVCQNIIMGMKLTALGSAFHPACFKCTACDKQLLHKHIAKDDLPYHTECYEKLFSLRCCLCNDVIKVKRFIV